jgi:hypothetical protein
MASPMRKRVPLWLPLSLVAVSVVLLLAASRVRHIDALTELAGGAEVQVDATSPTGLAGGVRKLVRPDPLEASFEWIVQAQLALGDTEGRLRRTTYDNAPVGREVERAAPYRWWLMALARVESLFSDRPVVLSVERVARWSDPLLHGLLIIVVGFVVARGLGGWAAGLTAMALAGLFPLAGRFVAGQPDDYGLALGAAVLSLLCLAAGQRGGRDVPDAARGWWVAAGIAGGMAGWIQPVMLLVVLGGVGIGGAAATWWYPRVVASANWRLWSLAGLAMWLVGFVVEAVPDRVGAIVLHGMHPLQGAAWWAVGELLILLQRWRSGETMRSLRLRVRLGAAVIIVPAAVIWGDWFARTGGERTAQRLSNLPETGLTTGMWEWLGQGGVGVVAALLPLLLVGALLTWRWRRGGEERADILLVLGPLLVALTLAAWHLREAALLNVTMLVALAVVGSERFAGSWRGWPDRTLLAAGVVVAVILGFSTVAPKGGRVADGVVNETELQVLLERDLAHWLAQRVGDDRPVVLAPLTSSVSFYYYGGFGVLGTPHAGNHFGFAAAVRIAGASSPDEARVLAEGRNLRFIILPSWDPFPEEYVRLGTSDSAKSLIGMLQGWMPPRWLRPVAYPMPEAGGIGRHSVAVFEVVEVQEQALALARLFDYFLETQRRQESMQLAHALQQVAPNQVEALLARAQLAIAREDANEFAATLERLLPAVQQGEDEELTWDRRTALVLVLMQARQAPLVRRQLEQLRAEATEAELRSLSATRLYQLLVVGRVLGEPIADPALEALARRLLPPDLRERL